MYFFWLNLIKFIHNLSLICDRQDISEHRWRVYLRLCEVTDEILEHDSGQNALNCLCELFQVDIFSGHWQNTSNDVTLLCGFVVPMVFVSIFVKNFPHCFMKCPLRPSKFGLWNWFQMCLIRLTVHWCPLCVYVWRVMDTLASCEDKTSYIIITWWWGKEAVEMNRGHGF